MTDPDYLILCLSQPSLSAREQTDMLADLCCAGRQHFSGPVVAIRLEGAGQGLPDALRDARTSGATHVRVQPVGFPMAANMRAWLPGAVAHFAATQAREMRITLADQVNPATAATSLVAAALNGGARDALQIKPSLGKPGWEYLPQFAFHILLCTGPRCAFRGAAPLQNRLKSQLADAGLSDRVLTTTTGCLYPCNQGPVLVIYPQGHWYIVPDDAAVDRIIQNVLIDGGDAAELRLAERPGSARAHALSHPNRSFP